MSSAKRSTNLAGSARRLPIAASPLKGGALRVALPSPSRPHPQVASSQPAFAACLPAFMSPLHKAPRPSQSPIRRPFTAVAESPDRPAPFEHVATAARATPQVADELVNFIEEVLSPRVASGAVRTPAAKTPKAAGGSSRRKSGFMPFMLTSSGLTPARSGVDT